MNSGEDLKRWREKQSPSLTQDDVAKRLGVSLRTYQRWERGMLTREVLDQALEDLERPFQEEE